MVNPRSHREVSALVIGAIPGMAGIALVVLLAVLGIGWLAIIAGLSALILVISAAIRGRQVLSWIMRRLDEGR